MADVLAYDLGGSSLRVAIVSGDRTIRRMARVPLEIASLGGGSFEADPESWWQAFVRACAEIAGHGVDLGQVGAIAGCGFTRTQVAIDPAGQAVRPAIPFQDARGAAALGGFLGRAGSRLDGGALRLSPFHPIARLLWLRAQEPESWARTVAVIEPKDYVNLRLTGVVASDPISHHSLAGFLAAVEADGEIMGLLETIPERLPRYVSPFDEIGRVRDGLPGPLSSLAGRPVLCGGPDTWSCVLGSGGLRPGAAYATSGTSDVLGIISPSPCMAEGLLSVRWGPSHWQLGGPSQGAASRLQWAVQRFCPDLSFAAAVESALAGDDRPPIFLPYLEGERTPYWDADLRGAFVGLGSGHSGDSFLRAVAEGLGFLSRVILERAEAAAAMTATHVCMSGGLSRLPALCQLRADVLGRDVVVPKEAEAGLIGAASLAGTGEAEIDRIAEGILDDATRYRPTPSRRAALDTRFARFLEAHDALADVSRRIARGSGEAQA